MENICNFSIFNELAVNLPNLQCTDILFINRGARSTGT